MLKKLIVPALFSLIAGKKMQLDQQFAALQGQECPLGQKFICPEEAKFCSFPVATCYEEPNSEGIMKKLSPVSTIPTIRKEDGNWCPIEKGFYCEENCSECSTTGEMCFCKNEANEVVAQKPINQVFLVKKTENNVCYCDTPAFFFKCSCEYKFCRYPPKICFNKGTVNLS